MTFSRNLRGLLSIIFCVYFAFSFESNVNSLENEFTISIFHTNDIHGHFESIRDDNNNLNQIGLDIIKKIKDTTPRSILVDAGDAIQGSDLCSLDQRGIGDLLNETGYDLRTPGNHDFDFGSKQVIENAENSNCPILGANVLSKDSNSPLFDKINGGNGQNCIINVNGKKLGFFGLVTTETPHITPPYNVENIFFRDEISTAREQVSSLKRQGSDVIIAITHMGVNSSSGFTTSESLAEKVQGIDIIIDGHSHTKISERKNGTLIAQTGAQSSNLGKIEIKFSHDGKFSTSSSIISASEIDKDIKPDEKVLKKYKEIFEKIRPISEKVIGYTKEPLFGGTYNNCNVARVEETNLGDLVCDAMKEYAKENYKDYSDIPLVAFINGGGVRSTIKPGFISYGDALKSIFYGNKLCLQIISPKVLYGVLERGVGKLNYKDNNSFDGIFGGFPQVSGIKVDFDVTKKSYDYASNSGGERIVFVSLTDENGNVYKNLSRNDDETKIAFVSNYAILNEFPELSNLEVIKVGDNITDILANYISKISLKNGMVDYKINGERINLIKNKKYKKFDSSITVKDSFGLLSDANVNVKIDYGFSKKYKTDKDGKIYITDLETGFHIIEIENELGQIGECLVSNFSYIKDNNIDLRDKQSNDYHSVENLIGQIPHDASTNDKELVKFVRLAYDLLSDLAKKKVINYAKLERIERKLFGSNLIESNKEFFIILGTFLVSFVLLLVMFYKKIRNNKKEAI